MVERGRNILEVSADNDYLLKRIDLGHALFRSLDLPGCRGYDYSSRFRSSSFVRHRTDMNDLNRVYIIASYCFIA